MPRTYSRGTTEGNKVWRRGYRAFINGEAQCKSADPLYAAAWNAGYQAAQKTHSSPKKLGRPAGAKNRNGTDYYNMPREKDLEKRITMVEELVKMREAQGVLDMYGTDPLHDQYGLFRSGRLRGRKI